MPNRGSTSRGAWICVATLALLDACSFDAGKLRKPARADAAGAVDDAAAPADTPLPGRDAVAANKDAGDGRIATEEPDVPLGSQTDGAATGGSGGGLGGMGGSGFAGSPDADGAPDGAQGSGGQSGGEEAGSTVPFDGADPVEAANDVAETAADAGVDDAEGWSLDVPALPDPDAADAPSAGDLSDGPAGSEIRSDVVAVDARGKKTCPTSISGSLDRSDSTQVGRLSRVDPASVCGTQKDPVGNGADRTSSHLYDVYHFVNVGDAPDCFAFTLTYGPLQELFLAAYASFDPTNITADQLGDSGDTTNSPQTIGITVGAGATIDVVVSAVAMGMAPAGPYTLSCSTP